jgi:hypothetical protein
VDLTRDDPLGVVAGEAKAVAKVGEVREVALVTGVEVHGVAAAAAGFVLKVFEEGGSKSFFVMAGKGDEVIDIHDVTPGGGVQETISGGGGYLVAIRDVNDLKSFACLDAPAFDEFIGGFQMGAEFLIGGKTAADFAFVARVVDFGLSSGWVHRAFAFCIWTVAG